MPENGSFHVVGLMMRKAVDQATMRVRRLWVVGLLVAVLAHAGVAVAQDALLFQPQGLDSVGIHTLRQIDPALTGEGVRVGVLSRSVTYKDAEPQNDYQPNVGHACFQAAGLRFHDRGLLAPGISPHSTAVCSILFGEDPTATTPFLGPFFYQGVVPSAEGHIYEYCHFGEQYLFTQSVPPVDVITASFGFQFENWWTRAVESLAGRAGLPVVASVGNGTNASDPPLYPGAGSNVIGVGVVSSVKTGDPATDLMHFALAYPDQSTLGPTEDSRCKPDIVAPGNFVVAGAADDRSYITSGDWSSFATPVVAGVVGLLVQAARMDESLSLAVSPNGGNCAIKAILMSSATKLPFWRKGRLTTEDDHEVPLDFVQGAGMVNALGAHQILTAGRFQPGNAPSTGWDLNRVERDLPQVYRFAVDESAGKKFTATLTWNRHYADTYPFERIHGSDTDLRLEVWAIDPEDPGNDLLLDYSDSKVDNVEHIHVQMLPEYRVYELVVSYADASVQTTTRSERYGVAWTVGQPSHADSILWYDLNADGVVDEADLAIFLANRSLWLTSPDAYLIGDFNRDGVIDRADLESLFANQNRRADWHVGTATN